MIFNLRPSFSLHRLACLVLAVTLAAFLFSSCGPKKDGTGENAHIITQKIEYPVFIKSPYPDDSGDWWKENIETSGRLAFLETLFEWAYTGKVKAYDYVTNKPLTLEEVQSIGNEKDTIKIDDSNPPYEEKDTVIQNTLDFKLIHKVKFLEEWSFDLDNHTLTKKVLGVAPSLTVFGDSLEIKGYKPLFWIYFDEELMNQIQAENKKGK